MGKKKTSTRSPQKEQPVIKQPDHQEPVLSVMSGFFILLVTVVADITITRYILHKWDILAVDFTYMIYETAITVVCSAGMIVFLNYMRVGEACEKAQSPEDFPCGGPFGFLAGNPVILWIEVSILAGILFVGLNGIIFKVLGFASWKPALFLIYKVFYCLVMTFLVHWAVLGRMLQADWLQRKISQKEQPVLQKPKAASKKK